MNKRTIISILDVIIWIFVGIQFRLAIYGQIHYGMPFFHPLAQWIMFGCWVWLCIKGPIERIKEKKNEWD